ncbi:hypothetical protein ACFCV8_19135 [Streptomyces sp. NPDC056347]|uniref:hypothetical protein n=1 Tax=Streptomyces sp. NPDC056347 TaxID=3345790 RepID=UPI0035D9813B
MGVEEEYFLVDPGTREVVPHAGEVVRGTAADMGDPVSREPGRYQEESALPAVLVRASTVTGLRAVERGDPGPGISAEPLRAARDGLRGAVMDPRTGLLSRPATWCRRCRATSVPRSTARYRRRPPARRARAGVHSPMRWRPW